MAEEKEEKNPIISSIQMGLESPIARIVAQLGMVGLVAVMFYQSQQQFYSTYKDAQDYKRNEIKLFFVELENERKHDAEQRQLLREAVIKIAFEMAELKIELKELRGKFQTISSRTTKATRPIVK